MSQLVELSLVPLVAPGLFRSSDAIRAKIARGDLVRGVHFFQKERRGRIHVDLDACRKLIREEAARPKGRVIRLANGGCLA